MLVLLTRPEAEAERTAAKLRARGVEVLPAPMLRVEPVEADLGAGPWSGLVLTSVNAARALAAHRRRAELVPLPCFTVGRATAEAARAAGCADLRSADGSQRDLVRLIAAEQVGDAPLLYLAGADRVGDLAADLAGHGITLRTVVVYRAVTASQFPAEVAAALAAGRLDGVLHFSKRSAQAFLDCARAGGLTREALAPAHYCISRQAAAPLVAAGAAAVHIASHPDEAAMVERVCGKQ